MILFTDQPTNPPHEAYNNSVVRFKLDNNNNLIEDSDVSVGPTSNQSMHVYNLHRIIPNGTEVKLSMKATLGKEYFGIYTNNGNTYVNELWPANSSDGIFTKTFIWNGGSSQNLTVYQYGDSGESSIDWISLEETDENAIPIIMPTIATITVAGIGFEVYPNSEGEFYFNFKNLIPTLINEANFADNVHPNGNDYLLPDPDLFKEITAQIEVMTEEGDPQSTEVILPFLKSVKQKGSRPHALSDFRVLDHSLSQVSHLVYFEGMPFDVSIYSDDTRDIRIKNKKTQMEMTYTFSKGVNRLFISDGENDAPEGFENDIPLYLGVNELEFWEGTTLKFTLFLDKRPANCAPLLKWFNPAGGWSYWRFSPVFMENTNARTIERLYGDFDNLYDSRWNVSITGKDTERTRDIQTDVLTQNELDYIKYIASSPKVYLFTGDPHQPYERKDFIEVEINGNLTTSSKGHMKQQVALQMILPTQYSQTLW